VASRRGWLRRGESEDDSGDAAVVAARGAAEGNAIDRQREQRKGKGFILLGGKGRES